jgi:hypothetical protein
MDVSVFELAWNALPSDVTNAVHVAVLSVNISWAD